MQYRIVYSFFLLKISMYDLVTNIVLRDARQSKTINRFITLLSFTMVLRFIKFDIWIQGNHRESLRGSII